MRGWLLWMVGLWVVPVLGAAAPPDPKDVLIMDQPGALLPKALTFENQDGAQVLLGSYLDGQKPLILVLAYYSCPNLCTLVLNGLTAGMAGLQLNPGKDYNVVTVSVDPRDDAALAAEKRKNHIKALGREVPGNGWDFLVSHDGGVRTLAQAVGFGYRFEEETREYAHSAGIFVFTPDGRLHQTLHGAQFPAFNLRLALLQAGEGAVGGALDRLLAWCFVYEPLTRTYDVAVARVVAVSAVPGLLALLLVVRRVLRGMPRAARTEPQPQRSPG